MIGASSLNHRVWLNFDLAGALPAGTTWDQVQKATLKVFANTITNTSTGSLYITAAPASSTPLSEQTITHALLGAGLNDPETQAPYATVNVVAVTPARKQYITFNVTELVRDWLDGKVVNNGLIISGSTLANVTIDSKEDTTTGHPATLDLVFAPARVHPRGDASMGIFVNGPQP